MGTTSRRKVLSTWSSDSEEVCRSLSRLSLARPLPWRLSLLTQLRMSRLRSKTRKESPRPAEIDLCWKAIGGWKNSFRLQHPEGKHSPSCAQTERRKLSSWLILVQMIGIYFRPVFALTKF